MTAARDAGLNRALAVQAALIAENFAAVGGLVLLVFRARYGLGDQRFEFTFPQHFTSQPLLISHTVTRAPSAPVELGDLALITIPQIENWSIDTAVDGIPRWLGATTVITIDGPPGTEGTIDWGFLGPAAVGSTFNPPE